MSKKEYFAYGSNLNFEQMAYRCPEATAVGTAKLAWLPDGPAQRRSKC